MIGRYLTVMKQEKENIGVAEQNVIDMVDDSGKVERLFISSINIVVSLFLLFYCAISLDTLTANSGAASGVWVIAVIALSVMVFFLWLWYSSRPINDLLQRLSSVVARASNTSASTTNMHNLDQLMHSVENPVVLRGESKDGLLL